MGARQTELPKFGLSGRVRFSSCLRSVLAEKYKVGPRTTHQVYRSRFCEGAMEEEGEGAAPAGRLRGVLAEK